MLRRLRVLVLLVSTPLVVLVLVGGLLGTVGPTAQTATEDLRVFDDVIRLIFGAYVEPASVDDVMDGAMRGLTDSLDSSTSYLTPEEVRSIDDDAPLPTGDLGLTVTRQYYLRIVGVEDGSPAALAGLRSGDFIRTIGDIPTRDMSAFAGERLLRGAVGSSVRLLIIRGNTADPHEVNLVRETPKRTRAAARLLPSGEAYLRVSSFESGAAEAIATAVGSLGAAAAAGLLVDVRGVADGSAEEGIAAARLFVSQGVLATRSGRRVESTVVEAGPGDGAFDMPTVLIVSNGTALAAEVFAAALADNDRTTLVGEPTAGLAGLQTLIRLPEGHGLWMTTERYTLGDGTPIHGQGLPPDVFESTEPVEFGEAPPEADALLDRAREILRDGPPDELASSPSETEPAETESVPPVNGVR